MAIRITIFAAGSRGDVQPCVVLGKALQQAGFNVLLVAPENFSAFIQEHKLCFQPLRGDVRQIMGSETGRKFMQNGSTNLIAQIRAMRTMLGPVAMKMAEDALEACRGADALISLAVFAPFMKSIAEIRGIPLINAEPTPLLPTRDFPAPGWPVQRNLGRLHNRLSGLAMLQVIWQWYGPFANSFRQGLKLQPYTAGSFYRILSGTPLLGAYSSKVIPHPQDWPESVSITGFWFLEEQAGWQPPPRLEAFLEAGDPPVYVGFGSMAGRQPEYLATIVLEALAKSGQRGLLLTGWGGMRAMRAPENVFVLDSAPHHWLFPRMAAVVHHGGAGTTAEGLRSGVPSVILPFMMDQPFWGKRVRALGAGPGPVPIKKLTVDNLAGAINAAVTQPEIRLRAARLGEAIRAEDGVGVAVKVVKECLGV
jgi:UDP:flavonoid glycosyltransferase YjiC (YdhE family)